MRLYRALLRLYPSRFHAEYRDELCRAFVAKHGARSWPVRAVAAVVDVIPNALGAHWDILRHGAAAGTTVPAFSGDIRYAFRQIARTPVLSGVVIAVLALGIGINTGLLTLTDAYAWRPAPGISRDPSLARLTATARGTGSGREHEVFLSRSDLRSLREQRDVFIEVAAWELSRLPADFSGGAESILVQYSSANLFPTLRVELVRGSGFSDDQDRSPAAVVIITHSLWLSHFGGADDVIGKSIRIMNRPFTIVGVAPPLFFGVNSRNMYQAVVWVPLGARALLEPGARTGPGAEALRTVARLAPGVGAGEATSRMAPLAVQLAQLDPEGRARLRLAAERLTGAPPGSSDTTELVVGMLLIAALIILITCTNVSALLLGRAAARRREIGVRLAMGATRIRLIRQMLTESLVHALSGALLGVALYTVVVKVAYATIPDLIYGLEPRPVTFLWAAGFALMATLVFGLAPALHATSADIGEVMKNSGNHAIRRSRMQKTFVVMQLACSQPVLIVAALVLADLRYGVGAGDAPASVVTMESQIIRPDSSDDVGPGILAQMRNRLAEVPGVRAAAMSTEGFVRQGGFFRVDDDYSFELPDGGGSTTNLRQRYVSADYFVTQDLPLVRGRGIGAEEDHPGSGVIVVNAAAARQLWPGRDPVGRQLIRHAGATTARLEVIGVAGTAPYDLEDETPRIFVPLATAAAGSIAQIAVRTAGNARDQVPALRAALREVEPFAGLYQVTTLAERFAVQRREAVRANVAALGVGLLALLLASLGLYAIIAFAVAQRTREIGVRLAVGATTSRVVREFCRDGMMASLLGLGIGLPVTVAAIRVVQARMLGFTVRNVAAVAMVIPVLVGVAALASWLPARRAGRVDPVIALRSE